MQVQTATYDPRIFDVGNLAQARQVILTPENGVSSHERWQTETPYLVDLIASKYELSAESWVLDYGCGVGRLAKELIGRHGCRVVGVDISTSMRALATSYVASPRFVAVAPEMLDVLPCREFDLALAVWVLQHCLRPDEDIKRIRRCLGCGGGLFVLNNTGRAVPTTEHGWVADGVDVWGLLDGEFRLVDGGSPHLIIPDAERWCSWCSYVVV